MSRKTISQAQSGIKYNTMMSLLVWSSLFLSAALILLFSRKKKAGNGNQQPTTTRDSRVANKGNILGLGTIQHQDFYKLRSKYGPVLGLKLGSVNTMVIQYLKRLEPQGTKET
ncbi:hypothetical protein Ddye_008119 [Dipteronia dyeriana]|uniref:Uncharacterized protein n=1 Tax=Dipteronia dyeriana TaxID=168575 RepID=A0AAD9X973_9ROSI|nr:hypothetical protein Ddye_008119 [Dipteronia dyeriana]